MIINATKIQITFFNYALLVTIVVLIILAGITLNAVIGENGIIFQAKDTKNLVDNETKYDNEQLASLQNELKDNQLYSGIGIIPGTDQGGSSEGGENGSSGTNQGGSNTGGDNQNQNATVKPGQNQNPGGTTIDGKTDEDPKFYVVSGEEIAASFYQSDVTIQIYTNDRSKKIKYILSTTVDAITNELYPSGLVRELDIENGGTLTFTQNGEYTITAYAYDTLGNKSNPTIMWFKRQMGNSETTGGITVSIVSGNEGANKWYTSNVTLRVLGTDTGSKKIKYRIQGTATSLGQLGDVEVTGAGNVDTREIEIANGTTFRIVADGTYTITAYSYDAGGMRLSQSEVLNLKKDSTRPIIQSFTGEQITGSGFKVSINAKDDGSKLTTTSYTYRYKESSSLEEYISDEPTGNTARLYTGLDQKKTYDMYAMVKDQAGNVAITDVIARPSLYISNSILVGETINNGVEGARKYSRSDTVALTFRGQDSNNVDIMKTAYQVIGTADKTGSIAGNNVIEGQQLSDEYAINDKETRIIQLRADGNWTVKIHNYNKEGKLVTTNIIEVTIDTERPRVINFRTTSTEESTQKINGTVDRVVWGTSGPATSGTYTYYLGTDIQESKVTNTHTYLGININTLNSISVLVKDKAGNVSDLFSPTNTSYYLADLVNVGDFVEYDAGSWQGTELTTKSGWRYSGFVNGSNKSAGINGSDDGWLVMNVKGRGVTGSVELVTAGIIAEVELSGDVDSFIQDSSIFADELIYGDKSINARCWNYRDYSISSGLNFGYAGSVWLYTKGTEGYIGTIDTYYDVKNWWCSPATNTNFTYFGNGQLYDVYKATPVKTCLSIANKEIEKEHRFTITKGPLRNYYWNLNASERREARYGELSHSPKQL